MGGTFMSLPKEYRDDFIAKLHDALSGHVSSSVVEAVKFSEISDTKCIGITIETRPDYCLPRHMDDMLAYGCTRLEIGVQSVYEDVARDTNRGHTVSRRRGWSERCAGQGSLRDLPHGQGHGLQGGHPHDAQPPQRAHRPGPGAGEWPLLAVHVRSLWSCSRTRPSVRTA